MDLSVRPELASRNPLLIHPTPVYRIYQGGLLLERFRGVTSPKDDDFPEDWVGSVTDALNVGREGLGEGLSVVVLPDGSSAQLKELILQYPKAILGLALPILEVRKIPAIDANSPFKVNIIILILSTLNPEKRLVTILFPIAYTRRPKGVLCTTYANTNASTMKKTNINGMLPTLPHPRYWNQPGKLLTA